MVATRRSKRKTAPASGSQNQSKDATPSAQKRSKKQKEETPKELKVGDACPEFTLETDEDKAVTLKDLIASQPIIIFMYPRANTPGCTKQACGFRDNYSAITKNGYGVYGLSGDKPIAQRTWKSKQQYQYNFLCDVDHKFMKALGVSSGKKITRSHVIVGTDGNLLDIQIGISPEKSVSEAIDYAKTNPHSSENQQTEEGNEGDGKVDQGEEQQEDDAKNTENNNGNIKEDEEQEEEDKDADMKDAAEDKPKKPIVEQEVPEGDSKKEKEDWEVVDKQDQSAPNGEAEKPKEGDAPAPQKDAEVVEPAASKGEKEDGAAEEATSELPMEIATETVANGDTEPKKVDAKVTPQKDDAQPAGGAKNVKVDAKVTPQKDDAQPAGGAKNVKEAKADGDAAPAPAEQAGENDKVEAEQPPATAT